MIQELLLAGLDARRHDGVDAQPLHQLDKAGVDVAPQLVVRVGAKFGDEALGAPEDLGEDPLVDGARQPPRRLGAQPLVQHLPVGFEVLVGAANTASTRGGDDPRRWRPPGHGRGAAPPASPGCASTMAWRTAPETSSSSSTSGRPATIDATVSVAR